MRLEIGRVDHHRLGNGGFGSKTIHHPSEDTLIAPPLPSIVEGLRRAVFFRCIAPPQPIAIDEDYSAQHPPVIYARLTVALGKEGLESRHLRLGQPEKVAHRSISLRRLNHAASRQSMGPDPTLALGRSLRKHGQLDFEVIPATDEAWDGLAREKWRAPTAEAGGVLWETGTDRRRSFGVKRYGWR